MAAGPEVSVILPTLNERESLALLHPRLEAALGRYPYEVIVVDDASPDGTADYVRGLATSRPYRVVERRGVRGLASAVVEGFRLARGRAIAVMDADGSHPPELLPGLLDPVLSGRVEMALGSRRATGGAAPGLTGVRRLISVGAALLARPLTPVGDPMSGFFAVDRRVLGRGALAPVGYKIALEVIVKCRPQPLLEVPFEFAPRVAGVSKLGGIQVGEYVRHVLRLYGFAIARYGRASSTR